MKTMSKMGMALVAGAVASSAGCSFGLQAECGPEPVALAARAELARGGDSNVANIGDTVNVTVHYFVNWGAGEIHPQEMGESCVEKPAREEMVEDFDVVDAHCADDACEIVDVSGILLQQQREIRIRLKKPTAQLSVRVTPANAGSLSEIPEAIGELEIGPQT